MHKTFCNSMQQLAALKCWFYTIFRVDTGPLPGSLFNSPLRVSWPVSALPECSSEFAEGGENLGDKDHVFCHNSVSERNLLLLDSDFAKRTWKTMATLPKEILNLAVSSFLPKFPSILISHRMNVNSWKGLWASPRFTFVNGGVWVIESLDERVLEMH